ncbi:hypothetical protein GCM10018793_50100 [Streptomyces sulfonofaciens]|uniref:Methylamine utilisation protein MauE domain-containing protein n=1 Tax=Streptomyces sulfonofaciens TaxID=68272 RepID=A0A919L6Q3_9ACTN|nr:MauE/DoxX family redox-associated membrane protein [Streptomyces sulfonofaciens]GHH84746.1 hypothetical protein GCM10018793_50100 [Streptomyces sulfonofaciens]
MISLLSTLAPLLCGGLLAATGAGKLFGRQVARQAAGTVLVRLLGDGRRAARALRCVGAAELAVAAGLLAAPRAVASCGAAAVLGAGFLGYLGYAKATAPRSSCGCTAGEEGPIGWRSFTRAALVVAAGLAAPAADGTWWSAPAGRPVASAVLVLLAAAVLVVLFGGVDRLWLLPLRRARLRVFGHPLGGPAAGAPVAASVELLERSLAWQAASAVVRSGLLDHWDEDGWRILRYAGVHEGGQGARPVNVLFALDLAATVDNTPRPAVRVTVVDDATDEVVQVPLPTAAPRTLLPLAEPA